MARSNELPNVELSTLRLETEYIVRRLTMEVFLDLLKGFKGHPRIKSTHIYGQVYRDQPSFVNMALHLRETFSIKS